MPNIQKTQLEIKIDSLISRHGAERAFHQYIRSFVPKFPIVVFPLGTTAQLVRETKPLLFLAIISIASGGCCSVDEQKQLVAETKRLLIDRAVVQGDKYLELVQALQVVLLWYRVPGDYKQMNLNQLARIMITLAIDLGLDKFKNPEQSGTSDNLWCRVELQRAWLGCLFLCARYFRPISSRSDQ